MNTTPAIFKMKKLWLLVAVYLLGTGCYAASRPSLSKKIDYSYPATPLFVPEDQANIVIKMKINPQVIQIDSTTLAVVDFEAQAKLIIFSNLVPTKSFNISISQGDSDVGVLPAVIYSSVDNSIIIFYAYLQTSNSVMSSLRATKIDTNGNILFDNFVGNPTQNVTYITATRINQTHFAVVASNLDINTSTLYIMMNDLSIRSGLPVHLTTTPLAFSLASDGTFLYYASCFTNVSEFCSIIKYNPSDMNVPLGSYEVASYTDVTITHLNDQSLLVVLQVAGTKSVVKLDESNLQPLQSLATTTISLLFTSPYPVFTQGYYALIYRWDAPWYELPFDIDNSGVVTWNNGFDIGPYPGTTLTQFNVGVSKHLMQQNGYVVSLKEVDVTTNTSTITLQFFGDFCGDMNVTGSEQCEGSTQSCINCQCATGTMVSGGQCLDVCGNGIVTGAEQCDGGANCGMTCQCTAGSASTIPPSNGCISNPAPVAFSGCTQCQGDTPTCLESRSVCVGSRIVPILQCIDYANNGVKTASFSYQNRVSSQVSIATGANNNLSPSGVPVESFLSGRPFFYPLSAFTSNYSSGVTVSWFVDGYLLTFDTSDSSLACPTNVSFLVVISPPATDLTAFIANLRIVLADTLNIDVNRITGKDGSNKKRQSDLEQELEVTISAGNSSEPSASDVVTNFVGNQTAINQVKEDVPEVQDIIGKPLENEVSGSQVTANSPQVASTPPIVSVSASSTISAFMWISIAGMIPSVI